MISTKFLARLGGIVAVVLSVLIISITSAQEALQGDALRELYKLSGLGIIGREIAGELNCEPMDIALLDSVDGRAVAELELRMAFGCTAFLVQAGNSEQLYRDWDHPEISYESIGLVYYECREGFARVFERSRAPGFWVRIADMPEGRLRPWSEVLVQSRRTYVGYEGHTLHERPSEESPTLVALRERRIHESCVHQLIPTGELSGDWGEFEVVEFTSDFYILTRTPDSETTGNRWKGWLRLVNSEGSPEFWFFTRD